MKEQPDERHRARCGELADRLIEPLRAKARELGYAIGVHGSLQRDIDLIAVAWTREAVSARELAEALQLHASMLNGGLAWRLTFESGEYFDNGSPGAKPHGRLVWSFHLGGGPYIDLSVIPPRPDA